MADEGAVHLILDARPAPPLLSLSKRLSLSVSTISVSTPEPDGRLVSIVYTLPRCARNEKTSLSSAVPMTPFSLEPSEILVADERLPPWSSAGAGAGAGEAPRTLITAFPA